MDLTIDFGDQTPTLHRVMTLDTTDPRLGLSLPFRYLTMVYGYQYGHGGCFLSYKIVSEDRIEVLSLEPDQFDPNWPRDSYPLHFPLIPIDFLDVVQISWAEAQPLAWQHLEPDSETNLFAIVPAVVGDFELWCEEGTGEQVQTLFSFDADSLVMKSSNQCT